MASELGRDEVMHQSDHVGCVHVDLRGIVLRQTYLREVTASPDHVVRVCRGRDDFSVRARTGHAILLTTRGLHGGTCKLSRASCRRAPYRPVTVGPMDVPTSTRRITHIGDAIVMRLAHEDETVERGIEHVLRQHPATRQTPGNTPATRQPDPATPGNPATRAQDREVAQGGLR